METVLEIKCAWCGKDMGSKDGQCVTGVSHSMCEDCESMERLKNLAIKTNVAYVEFLKALHEDTEIAEGLRSQLKWQHEEEQERWVNMNDYGALDAAADSREE